MQLLTRNVPVNATLLNKVTVANLIPGSCQLEDPSRTYSYTFL